VMSSSTLREEEARDLVRFLRVVLKVVKEGVVVVVEDSVARRMLLTEGSRAPRGCIVLLWVFGSACTGKVGAVRCPVGVVPEAVLNASAIKGPGSPRLRF
jgi:hypothetical protein